MPAKRYVPPWHRNPTMRCGHGLLRMVSASVCAAGLAQAAAVSPALASPWDPAPAPYLLEGDLIPVTQPQTISRDQHLQQDSGYAIQPGVTLTVEGAIQGHNAVPLLGLNLWKLGGGHLQLNAPNAFRHTLHLRQGSLGLGPQGTLGAEGNELYMAAGTRLDLADGLQLPITLRTWAPGAALDPWAWPLPADSAVPGAAADGATLNVAHGTAHWLGDIVTQAPLVKTGAGTLRLAGPGFGASVADLRLEAGGLQLDSAWWGSVVSAPGAWLSGHGSLGSGVIQGTLQPGSAERLGTLMVNQHLALQAGAHTRIRLDAQGAHDQLWSLGTARLAGDLTVQATPGTWRPSQQWEIIHAEDGLDYGPDPGQPAAPGEGRFARVHSNLRYLDPVLDYQATRVLLGWRYNDRAALTGEADWRSAVLEDTRFVRESALQHTPQCGAWAQAWGAQTQRAGAHGRAGDRRHTQGLQLGYSHALNPRTRLAVFAGWQDNRLNGDQSVTSEGWHLGLAASTHTANWQWQAGMAHSWLSARSTRRADPAEPQLHADLNAGLSQAWLAVQPAQPWRLSLGASEDYSPSSAWQLRPSLQLAWLHLQRRATDEHPARHSLAAVHLPAQTDTRGLLEPAVHLQRQWAVHQRPVTLSARLGWRLLWGARNLESPQTWLADPQQGTRVHSLPLARQALRLDLGLHMALSNRWRAQLSYTSQWGGGQKQHGAWLSLVGHWDGTPR